MSEIRNFDSKVFERKTIFCQILESSLCHCLCLISTKRTPGGSVAELEPMIANVSTSLKQILLNVDSVTRLGYFWSDLVTNFVTKVVKICADFWSSFAKCNLFR